MRRLIWGALVAVVLGGFAATSAEVWSQGQLARKDQVKSMTVVERGAAIAADLSAGKFDDVVATFSRDLKNSLSAAGLRDTWSKVEAQLGKSTATGEPRQEREGDFDVVFVRYQFAAMALDLKVVFDKQEVSGFFLVPAK